MIRPFVDSNIVVYAHSDDEKRFAAGAVLLLAPIISVQVLNEFTSVARRKLAFDWARIDASIADLMTLCPVVLPLTVTTHANARKIAERYGLGIYDATIVASALEARCDTLFSEDMHDGLIVEGKLAIRNPFAKS